MADVTTALVAELRAKTGAGIMDCKRALTDSAGDIEAAVDWLRKKGLSAAAKKSGRVAAEGLIAVATRGTAGAAVEVNSETDFVARNKDFQSFVEAVSRLALDGDGNLETLRKADYPGSSGTVEEELTRLVSTIGENIVLRRVKRLSVDEGGVFSYVHNVQGIAKIGVLAALRSSASTDSLAGLGKQLAMHIAAANPLFLDIASVPQAALDRERDVLREQAHASGKPAAVVDKMVDGWLSKFHEENVLLEQMFVVDQKIKIAKLLDQASKTVGASIRIDGFVRFALGEGIERPLTNTAA